jgi:predicted porin
MAGYFDRGYTVTNNTNNAKDAKGVSSSAGTTGLRISGVQDIGQGLRAGFLITTDFADLAGANQDSTATTASSIQTGGFNNSQSYLEVISKDIGTLRLGTVNNEILTATTAVAAPAFSTGVGSAYSSSWSTHDGYGTGVTGSGGIVAATALSATGAGSRGIRQANTIKYVSPNFSGATFAYGMAPRNSTSVVGTVDTVGVTDMSLRYAAGPLDVMYASLKYDVGTGAAAPANGALTAGTTNTQTMLAASYAVLPTLKLHAGSGKSKASVTSLANSSSTQYGVSYTMGNIVIMAQTAKVDDKNTTAYDRKMTGLGADYNFSKTTRAYVRYDSLNLNTATASSGSEIKRTAIGISQSF